MKVLNLSLASRNVDEGNKEPNSRVTDKYCLVKSHF